ncbi:probable G-protein coupled receptor 139 isoform X1 [Mercenaria mercenaria]|uniref:probable G-protein coupled receptor 139 isoform X1 n=1 Tax=Mercenaria mercenaria TaxID=6596 RepID=UPI001E1DB3CE|nr:probable G-protein coupled receptor 139 isoform X1 [Mercenaria mercenaria]
MSLGCTPNVSQMTIDSLFAMETEREANLTQLQSTTLTPPDTMDAYETFYYRAQYITGLVFYPILCILGMTGNIMSIIVMSQKQMRSSTNTYLFALAVSDLIKLFVDFLYFMVILLNQIDTSTGNKAYVFLYPYAHYVFNASLCVSAWLIVSVAVERYVYVCHPTKVKFYCNIYKARTISFSVFIIMSVLAIPYAMRYRTIQKVNNETGVTEYDVIVSQLWQNQLFTDIYTWFQNLMRSIIPLVILIILNTCIMYGLRRCRVLRSKTPKKHRITTMLITVILVFLICITPDTIMSTFFGLGYSEENYLARGIREITDLLLLINSAANFVIYCIFNTIFWCQFRRLFCYTCIRRNPGITDERNLSLLDVASHVRSVNRRRSDL